MANILKMAKIHAIIGLLENKWTYRRIARGRRYRGRSKQLNLKNVR